MQVVNQQPELSRTCGFRVPVSGERRDRPRLPAPEQDSALVSLMPSFLEDISCTSRCDVF